MVLIYVEYYLEDNKKILSYPHNIAQKISKHKT